MLSVDEQIVEFIKLLDGKIKSNWQILAPSAQTRVLFYEMEDDRAPKKVEGSAIEMRSEIADQIKKTKRGNK